MNIRIGDYVRFITEKIEGKVTGIIDENTVNVYSDEYGFEIPASVLDLVVVRSEFTKQNSDSPSTTTHKPSTSKNIKVDMTHMLYISIVPSNFNNLQESKFDFYIINDTEYITFYSINFFNGEKYNGISAANCNPEENCFIGTYNLKEIDTLIKSISLQAIFFKKGTTIPKSPVDIQIKINSTNLCKSGSYKHTKWFNSPVIVRCTEKENTIEEIEIDSKQLEKAIKEKKIQEIPKPSSRPLQQLNGNILEIDLHANEILETTAGMESKDILEYQLDIFRKTLDEYKLRKGQKIVFIHGKGEGVLRQRILWELQTRYKRYRYQDASFKQYGYGATMVTIK